MALMDINHKLVIPLLAFRPSKNFRPPPKGPIKWVFLNSGSMDIGYYYLVSYANWKLIPRQAFTFGVRKRTIITTTCHFDGKKF